MKVERGIDYIGVLFHRIGDAAIFHGFNHEERVEGEEQFELGRAEILASTLYFMKGRFDPLLKNPILTWMQEAGRDFPNLHPRPFLQREFRTTHPNRGGGGGDGVFCLLVCVFCPLVYVFVRWCVYIFR
jgi:hypothetical protein